MPHQKSLHAVFVETVLFITVFALVGHLGVNYWERFVVQKELCRMKTSLNSLKKTVNTIGDAYDNLHQELKGVEEIAEQKICHPPLKVPTKPQSKDQSTSDLRFLKDIQVETMLEDMKEMKNNPLEIYLDKSIQAKNLNNKLGNDAETRTSKNLFYDSNDKKVGSALSVYDKITQNLDENKISKSATTLTIPLSTNKIDRKVSAAPSIYDKMTQSFLDKYNTVARILKNATTITRYPLKSTGVGLGGKSNHKLQRSPSKESNDCSSKNRNKHKNKHHCFSRCDRATWFDYRNFSKY